MELSEQQVEWIINTAAEAGAKAARREYESMLNDAVSAGAKAIKQAQSKIRDDERRYWRNANLRNTRLLMEKYAMLKLHFQEAVYRFAEDCEDSTESKPGEIWEIMNGNPLIGEAFVESIYKSSARTAVIIQHIDHMLKKYQATCHLSYKESDARKCRVLYARYINEPSMPLSLIAEQEHINKRTAEKDLTAALEDLSALLFGVDAIETM